VGRACEESTHNFSCKIQREGTVVVPRGRWEGNFIIDLTGIMCEDSCPVAGSCGQRLHERRVIS
jgi:hypothetical protein